MPSRRALIITALIAIPLWIAAGAILLMRPDAPVTTPTPGEAAFQAIASQPERGLVVGRESAPVVMDAFISVACDACQLMVLDTIPALVRGPVARGQLRIRLIPVATRPEQQRAADLVRAAGTTGAGLRLMALIAAAPDADPLTLADLAPGMDSAGIMRALATPATARALARDRDLTERADLIRVPTFIITGPGGRTRLVGPQDPAGLGRVIDRLDLPPARAGS